MGGWIAVGAQVAGSFGKQYLEEQEGKRNREAEARLGGSKQSPGFHDDGWQGRTGPVEQGSVPRAFDQGQTMGG